MYNIRGNEGTDFCLMIVAQCLVCWSLDLGSTPDRFVFLIPSRSPWPVYADIKLNITNTLWFIVFSKDLNYECSSVLSCSCTMYWHSSLSLQVGVVMKFVFSLYVHVCVHVGRVGMRQRIFNPLFPVLNAGHLVSCPALVCCMPCMGWWGGFPFYFLSEFFSWCAIHMFSMY